MKTSTALELLNAGVALTMAAVMVHDAHTWRLLHQGRNAWMDGALAAMWLIVGALGLAALLVNGRRRRR